MRLGGWTRRSYNLLFCFTIASAGGTLFTTLRSYVPDDLTQATNAAIDTKRD